MTAQQFDTLDVLRLEVRGDPAPGAVSNALANPAPHLGAWGWLTPLANTAIRTDSTNGFGFDFFTTVGQAAFFESEFVPVKPGATHARFSFVRKLGTSNLIGVRGRVVYYDAAQAQIGQSAQSAIVTADATVGSLGSTAMTGGTKFVKLRYDVYRSGGNLNANDFVVTDFQQLFLGTAAELASPDLKIDDGWVDVLGPTHEIAVERSELNLGTLTATILDSSLDPSQDDLIRKGKAVRLVADLPSSSDPEPLFVGTVRGAKVTYDLTEPDASKRARIQLLATDQAQPLANTTRSEGVAQIDELPYVLEGCGVAWNVNGNAGQILATPAVASRNDSAKAIDQVAITRDSALGYAWFDRRGAVEVWDAADLTAEFGDPVVAIDEDVYNPDVVIDFDTERCINIVNVKYLRHDPATGESAEVAYGPYVDELSRSLWGDHSADYTVHGLVEDATSLEAYAAAILAANATPQRRILECTLPFNTVDEVEENGLRDLYDLVALSNSTVAVSHESRVTKITHRITPGKWLMTLGFTVDGGVAQPQVTPDIPPRPSTWWPEVRMLYGNPATDCPPDFLPMTGAAFDPLIYPELAAHLGAAVTPDMTDKFPIGAGTKALGTSGGTPTKPVPVHTHPISNTAHTGNNTSAGGSTQARVSTLDGTVQGTHNHGGNTGAAAGAAFDVMNPWRAIFFIIRAR